MQSRIAGELGTVCLSRMRTEDDASCVSRSLHAQRADGVASKEVTRTCDRKLETAVAALKSSGSSKDIETGMKIHSSLVATGDDTRVEIVNALVHMYAKCGSMTDASRVFEKSEPSTVLWNTLISGYLDNKEFGSVLLAFERMQLEGCKLNSQSFIAALKACASLAAEEQARKIQGKLVKLACLEKAMAIHSIARKLGYEQELAVGNTLVHVFAKCRSMLDAMLVFQRMQCVSSVSWTALIFGYVENGESLSALEAFKRMQDEGFKPTALTYVSALKACAKNALREESKQVDGRAVKVWSLETGMAIHSRARSHGHETDAFLANTLVDMYAKCGCLNYAVEAFEAVERPSVVSWNTLMSGCAAAGDSEAALRVFEHMQRGGGVTPNARSYVAALDACANIATKEQSSRVEGKLVKVESLQLGRGIHSLARKNGYELDLQVGNTITHMYAKCGSLVEALEVFHTMPVHDTVSYNILMFGYVENGDGEAALRTYSRLRDEGLSPSSLTYVAALKACACAAAREDEKGKARYLVTGRKIHCQVRKSGLEMDIFVASTLLDMYSKCQSMSDALEVFDRMTNHDVVSWNAMIFGYEQVGEAEVALEFYQRMRATGCRADGVTYVAVLKACAACGGRTARDGKRKWLKRGEEVCREIERSGYEPDMFLASTLVDFYAKCGSLAEARQVFERMPRRDVVSWNAVIYGYTESGEFEMALELFPRMQGGGMKPNALTYTALFKSCGGLAALETGRSIHAQVCREGVQESLLLSSIVDFYGKCGSILESELVFTSMESLSSTKLVTWNALMSGYAHQGKTSRVFDMLVSMQEEGVTADQITFLAVLTACAQAGLEDKGRMFLQRMGCDEFKVTPGIKHYTCMVDLLGRSNRLDEAVRMVQQCFETQADVAVWRTVLCASRKWKNVQAGKVAFENIKKLEPRDVAAYVLMGNIYASLGMWHEKALVWEEKCKLEYTRCGGKSTWTDAHGEVHSFS